MLSVVSKRYELYSDIVTHPKFCSILYWVSPEIRGLGLPQFPLCHQLTAKDGVNIDEIFK